VCCRTLALCLFSCCCEGAKRDAKARHIVARGRHQTPHHIQHITELSAAALPSAEHLATFVDQPRKRRLTWGDVPALSEVWAALEDAGAPEMPLIDGAEWAAQQHHGRYGHAARGPFYVWREWAAANLAPRDAEVMAAMARVMADDDARSAALKQAQFVSFFCFSRVFFVCL
jgi:hypothetical protein